MEVYNKINDLLTEMNQYTELLKEYKEKNIDTINETSIKEFSDTNKDKKISTINSSDIINVVNTDDQNKNSDINHFINLDELNKL